MAPHSSTLLPGKSHGRRSLVGFSPWSRQESDTTEQLHFLFSLSCIGEGNGNPLQYSCLENPRDEAAWWAAVYGDAESRTRLKQLSSSSSKVILLSVQYNFKHFRVNRLITLNHLILTAIPCGRIIIISVSQVRELRYTGEIQSQRPCF